MFPYDRNPPVRSAERSLLHTAGLIRARERFP